MRTIAHISDLHFNRIDPRIAEALIDDLHRHPPSLLVVSGDLTQRARRRHYQAAARYLTRLPRPQLIVPGNHDVPLFDVFRRFLFPFTRYRRYITPALNPVYQDEELLVLGINTARSLTWKEGRISPQQLCDARDHLAAASPDAFKVIVTHHPFLPVPGEPRTVLVGHAAKSLAVFETQRVDLLLSGHLHLGYAGDVRSHHTAVTRSILSMQAGTAISTRRRRNEPNSYNHITIDRDHVTLSVRAWDGQGFARQSQVQYQCVDHAWRIQD